MANKTTVPLTQEQYETIITTMRTGGVSFRPNERIATALILEANLGVRIQNILRLRLQDFMLDGSRYRLNIEEVKTHKKRTFTVPTEVYQFVKIYCLERDIKPGEIIFPITTRAVEQYLQKVCDYLGYDNIGTHSFRKYFATEIYNANDHDVVIVNRLLQHSSIANTQRYLGVESPIIEKALQKHVKLP